jgi:hypothetical protein
MESPLEPALSGIDADPFAVPPEDRARRYDRLLALLDEWATDDAAAERDRRETLAALNADRRAAGMQPLTADGR